MSYLSSEENRQNADCDSFAGSGEIDQTAYEYRSCFSLSLSLISSKEGTEEAYKEYQLALRNFNYQLMILKQVLGLTTDLSSYTARHTWATMAYYCEVHPGVISEAMGHSSITVTETYLKPFKNKKIDEANVMVFSSFRKSFSVGNCLN